MIHLYYHGGSANHGCEALVRGTAKVLDRRLSLLSKAPEEDLRYGVDAVAEVFHDLEAPAARHSLAWLRCALDHKLHGDDYQFVRNAHRSMLSRVQSGEVCLSIGGDNYCYGAEGNKILAYYNRMLRERGAKTVLWGCSIEPEALTEAVLADLGTYSLIIARESITYQALLAAGLKQVLLIPDVAFQLDAAATPLPGGLREGQTVGINLSPLAQSVGRGLYENYRELVRYLLEETELDVLLLPHVTKADSDDREILRRLQAEFPETDRLAMAGDLNCMEYKGMISRCRFFVGARTHATIAAYSTMVPTLVSGYSVKAAGIARDLFGTEEHYVVPVQSLVGREDLTRAFRWLMDHEQEVRDTLQRVIPLYRARVLEGAEAIGRLI